MSWTDALSEVARRCGAAGFLVWGGPDDSQLRIMDSKFEDYYGDDTYAIFINQGLHAEIALRSGFEQFHVLKHGQPAIWSKGRQAVECELHSVYDRLVDAGLRKKDIARVALLALGKKAEDIGPQDRVEIDYRGDLRITVGACSEAFAIHLDALEYGMDVDAYFQLFDTMEEAGVAADEAYQVTRVDHHLTLRIEGSPLASESEAQDLLMRVGNAALFELDAAADLGLAMPLLYTMEERDVHPLEVAASMSTLRSPRLHRKYDPEPLSLYWYARAIPEMPLVQFLAYYQVLEYYFPAYSRTKTVNALRSKLREIYGVARETDVVGIFQALRTNRRAVFGQEKDQLRHTIEECMSPRELRDFLFTAEREAFYSDAASSAVSTVQIDMSGESTDQRGDVARRVYEIRNRIVHTKSEHDDLDPLLPFDREIELLRYDIELVRFLAQRVLAASAKPL